ncbi:cell wall protein DAN4 isoform X2 [Echeneis naucrates]|uniref:cell wall protein DAN4 isoform X2 n=1 Tax=Echeneis naucrates TaxID=173247 RepID=UPI0011141659|nr:T-cell surface protein tactile isoform X2 [Echeneis naucrates]
MSLWSSEMAGTALGAALSLLLYASFTQGDPDLLWTHSEMTEAEVGQNVTLPCTVKSISNLKIVSVEWSKKTTKLVVYSQQYGVYMFWPNVSIHIQNNTAETSMGSYLHLFAVNKWDAGVYVCDIASYPFGTIRKEMELKIKDALEVSCDADSAVEVNYGENMAIRCRASADAQYRWTKDKELVSANDTLQLWWVTKAQEGVYALTVNTRDQSTKKAFTITVRMPTTTQSTDVSTSYTSKESRPTDGTITTAPTAGLSTTDSSTWSTDTSDGQQNSGNTTTTAGRLLTSSENHPDGSATSSPPATHTDPYRLFNSTPSSNYSTVFRSTQEMATNDARKQSITYTVEPELGTSMRPEESSTLGNTTESDSTDQMLKSGAAEDAKRSHIALLIIVPILILTIVAGFLYRRHIIKQRMAQPPPFKPLPPPVKYTAARQQDSSPQPLFISRCNSVTEPGVGDSTTVY